MNSPVIHSNVCSVSAMRELTTQELDDVSAGIAPLVAAGAKLAGGAFITGFFGAAGAHTFNMFFSEK